ncbi:glycosyltransferase family 4 protein [Candidatus Pacearchaeota archaeon]|nr:glycosyltransferase family 4 protein [Candidatus Pacearchaeota archaeon]
MAKSLKIVGLDDEEPGGNDDKSVSLNGIKKKRIAILTFFYEPAGGGIPRYVSTLARKFVDMGHDIDIITASYGDKKVERIENITVYRLPCMNLFSEKGNEKAQAREFLEFLRNYSKERPDIFVAQSFHSAIRASGHSLALNIVSMERDIPLILTVHAFIPEDDSTLLKISFLKDLYWNRIVSVGSHLADSLFNQGVDPRKINVINPPVDIKEFKPGLSRKWLRSRINVSDKNFVILHASRLESMRVANEKGVFTLINALASIKDKNVKLLISAAPTISVFENSKAETIGNIMETAKLLGVEERVIVETFSPREMHHIYNGCDLFVMASQFESFGLAYAEAMACGLPVIGTSVGGVPEVIDNGKSGVLVEPDNHVELSKAINNMIKNYRGMKKMGETGRKFVVDNLSSDKICKKLIGTYESVISKYSDEKKKNLSELPMEEFPKLKDFQGKVSFGQQSLDGIY